MDMFSVSVFESYIYWSDRSDIPPNSLTLLYFRIICEWNLPSHKIFESASFSFCLIDFCPSTRTHANGSIKRGSKDNATDSVSLRTGIGVQLKDIKVFNRARQQGKDRDVYFKTVNKHCQNKFLSN